MKSFYFYNPTKILFGKELETAFFNELDKYNKILLLTGSNPSRFNIYEKLKKISFYEINQVKQNTLLSQAKEIINIAKEKKIDFIIAFGGGSVIDMAKLVSFGVYYKDLWKIILKRHFDITNAIDIGCIVTNFGSGSEVNDSFIVLNENTKQKVPFYHFKLYPKISYINPEFTYTMTKKQLANAVTDMYIHILEQYLTDEFEILHDRYCEANLKTIIENANNFFKKEYYYRSLAMWCSIQANNKLLSRGFKCDWGLHEIAHQITAYYNITHADSLVLIFKDYYFALLNKIEKKLIRYSETIFDTNIPKEGIIKTLQFFQSLGMKINFEDFNLNKYEVYKVLWNYFHKNKPYHFNLDLLKRMIND